MFSILKETVGFLLNLPLYLASLGGSPYNVYFYYDTLKTIISMGL